LLVSNTKEKLLKNIKILYQHVKEHCFEEEALMRKFNTLDYQEHIKEHKSLLNIILKMEGKIVDDNWDKIKVREFVDKWKLHIVDLDMPANNFMKQHYAF
jgi:putative two-component system protein, hydrogenase maturation factor HypX/HoxX